MSSETHQSSRLKFDKACLWSPEDTMTHAKNIGTSLENMLELDHLDPKQAASNEKAKDAYQECRELQEYLSAQLSSSTNTISASDIQESLDILTRAIISYEMVNAAAEGDWDSVDITIPGL